MPRIIGYDVSITGDTLYGPFTILDNQPVPVDLISMAASGGNYIQLQYSIERNGNRVTGEVMIVHDGINASISDESAVLADMGIVFEATISGSLLKLQYISDSTGFDAYFKYYVKRWS